MRRLTALLVAIAALGLAAVAGAEQTYTDTTGDSGAAPDLTQVVVGNDASQVTFQVMTAPRTPANDEAYLIFINTDANPGTGDDGDEVRVFMAESSGVVETWNGSAWVDAPANAYSVSFEAAATGLVWRVGIQRSVLGTTTLFAFVVLSAKFSGEEVIGVDRAPGAGLAWVYALTFKQCANGKDDDGDGKVDAADLGCSNTEDDLESDDPYTLAIGKAKVTPASGRAGKPIVVKARVTQVETSQPITTGSVSCKMKVGTATKRTAGQLASGTATCRLTAPKVAKPTTIRGTITVTSKSKTISAPFSFRAS